MIKMIKMMCVSYSLHKHSAECLLNAKERERESYSLHKQSVGCKRERESPTPFINGLLNAKEKESYSLHKHSVECLLNAKERERVLLPS